MLLILGFVEGEGKTAYKDCSITCLPTGSARKSLSVTFINSNEIFQFNLGPSNLVGDAVGALEILGAEVGTLDGWPLGALLG